MTPDEFANCLELALERPSILDKLTKVIADKISTDLSSQIDALKIEIANRDSKITSLENEVGVLKPLVNDVQALRASVKNRDTTIHQLESQVQRLTELDDEKEQYMRRNSVRISGLPERVAENPIEMVLTICNDVLKVSPPMRSEDIDRAHRVTQ